ncbi:helix-turn-helix domain-containing protein [Paenibacillus polymyxa]|uniref:helix-turn-helix domain-containing protein n=1 Tax=Paenibacillus polymyxa TaxID=1406 RepID=UPI0039B4308F
MITITNLRKFRKEKGWTQKETAVKIGISLDYIKKIECYDKIPSVKVLMRISDVFNCKTIDEILIKEEQHSNAS